MAADQDIMPGFLAAIVTQTMDSPRQINVSSGVGEVLPVFLGEPSQLLATPAMSRFDLGSVPPARPSRTLKPPLLQALTERSAEKVCMALETDQEAACLPFWDHDLETPLCCAMRNDCCSEIIEMLLASGAHASTEEDRRGNLPLTLLNWKIAALETPSP